MKEKLVTIRHPELDTESQVMAESVPIWVEQGWEVLGPTFPQTQEIDEDMPGEEPGTVFDLDENEPSQASEKE